MTDKELQEIIQKKSRISTQKAYTKNSKKERILSKRRLRKIRRNSKCWIKRMYRARINR